MSSEETIKLDDIVMVEADKGVFFSGLRFAYGRDEKEIRVGPFLNSDARALKEALK